MLNTIAALGLSAQTTMSYMLDVCGSCEIIVQDITPEKKETESVDEVLSVPSPEEEAEEAEA